MNRPTTRVRSSAARNASRSAVSTVSSPPVEITVRKPVRGPMPTSTDPNEPDWTTPATPPGTKLGGMPPIHGDGMCGVAMPMQFGPSIAIPAAASFAPTRRGRCGALVVRLAAEPRHDHGPGAAGGDDVVDRRLDAEVAEAHHDHVVLLAGAREPMDAADAEHLVAHGVHADDRPAAGDEVLGDLPRCPLGKTVDRDGPRRDEHVQVVPGQRVRIHRGRHHRGRRHPTGPRAPQNASRIANPRDTPVTFGRTRVTPQPSRNTRGPHASAKTPRRTVPGFPFRCQAPKRGRKSGPADCTATSRRLDPRARLAVSLRRRRRARPRCP